MMSRHLVLPLCGVFVALIGWLQFSPLTAQENPDGKSPNATGAASGTYRLAYKYQAGDSVGYETVHKVKFISQFKGTEEVATNCTETKKRYKVVRVHPNGNAELQLIIDWVRMKVNFGGDDPGTEFDSKDTGARSQQKFENIYKIIGKPQATLLCAPNGKVLKFVQEKATPDSIGKGEVQLKDISAQDEFSFLTIFPDAPIKVGDTWSEKSDTKVVVDEKLKQTIELKRTYKLESVDGNRAAISFKTAILTPFNNPSISIQLIQRETSGRLVFDMERGTVVSRTVDTDKTLIKPVGDNTAMRATSHLLERLLTQTAEVTDAPPEAVQKK
ncbi:MAG: hypothetical protein JWM11_7996 [Planctomycetaceae bacterium]|nr:hypothetical protein [Planctomycetaceae bacterium]